LEESENIQEEACSHGLFLHIFTILIETLLPACDRITHAIAEEVLVQH
jgi:hypothetical protein